MVRKLSKTPLIIIPGLGDRAGLYGLVVPFWGLLGYDVHVFSFGWEDDGTDFTFALSRLMKYVDDLDSTGVNIIGASAGGVAAVNALALRPEVIMRVVTVATPFVCLPSFHNRKLEEALLRIKNLDMINFNPRILSLYGFCDQKVSSRAMRSTGVIKRVRMVNHGAIIAMALTLYCGGVWRFLRD